MVMHNTITASVSHNTCHNKIPHVQWSDDHITKFDMLFNDCMLFCVAPFQRKNLDMDEIKEHSLDVLLNTKDDNDEFWR